MEARVRVLYTGGTIGMLETERGYSPAAGHLAAQLARLPQLHDPGLAGGDGSFCMPRSRFGRHVRYDVVEYAPLLDSSNMGIDDWARIARDIGAAHEDVQAFVVLHGTDTMAYTASALSFMLENLQKTVIVTGSQIPLSELRNDAIDNLVGALTLAGHFQIPEVGLYFRDKLLRGNRARKVDAAGLDAFLSPNAPPLAEVGIDVSVRWDVVRPREPAPLVVHDVMSPHVAALRIFPGLHAGLLENFLRPPLAGVVLETYGAGNVPDRNRALLDALAEASARGVVVVNVTQCLRGEVVPHYATGRALAEVGVVSLGDMTPEAALTKLSFLLGTGAPADEVRRAMARSLRGERTEAAAPRFSP